MAPARGYAIARHRLALVHVYTVLQLGFEGRGVPGIALLCPIRQECLCLC